MASWRKGAFLLKGFLGAGGGSVAPRGNGTCRTWIRERASGLVFFGQERVFRSASDPG